MIAHEPIIRAAVFVGVFGLLALWEALAPRLPSAIGRRSRWPGNLGIVILDTVLVRVLFPAAAVGMAILAEERGWGLFNQLALPSWSEVLISVVLLDLVIYTQHVLFHSVPVLWPIHRMHHSDPELDVTTGLRFHPVEIALSMLVKLVAVAVLGAPAVGVLIFEIVLNASSMFNHSNAALPAPVDRLLRRVLVTPDMHRVHHSIDARETHSNFGFNLPWWDHLFGTYRAQPAAGHEKMTIGVPGFRNTGDLRLDRMLLQPLRRDDAGREN